MDLYRIVPRRADLTDWRAEAFAGGLTASQRLLASSPRRAPLPEAVEVQAPRGTWGRPRRRYGTRRSRRRGPLRLEGPPGMSGRRPSDEGAIKGPWVDAHNYRPEANRQHLPSELGGIPAPQGEHAVLAGPPQALLPVGSDVLQEQVREMRRGRFRLMTPRRVPRPCALRTPRWGRLVSGPRPGLS